MDQVSTLLGMDLWGEGMGTFCFFQLFGGGGQRDTDTVFLGFFCLCDVFQGLLPR